MGKRTDSKNNSEWFPTGNNISPIVNAELCSHCGTCLAVCPQGCIALKKEHHDFIPCVGDGCVGCGLCVQVCPGSQIDYSLIRQKTPFSSSKIGGYIDTYICRVADHIITERAVAGGGIVTALTSQFFQMHPEGLVQWVSFPEKGTGYPIEAKLLDIEAFRKAGGDSIYIPSFSNMSFKNISRKDKRPILAIGLPCQIYSLELLRRINKELNDRIFCTVSLFCGLTVSRRGISCLIKNKTGSDLDAVNSIRFRDRKGMTVIFNDGQIVSGINKNEVNFTHMSRMCAFCHDQTGELSDISCGDAHLPLFTNNTDQAWSTLITRSYRGERLLQNAVLNDRIWSMCTDKEIIVRSQAPMLFFKKETLRQRIFLHRIFMGRAPRYGKESMPLNFSPVVAAGNIVFLFNLYFRNNKVYSNIYPYLVKFGLFKNVVKYSLYTDLKPLLKSIFSKKIVRKLPRPYMRGMMCMYKGYSKLKRHLIGWSLFAPGMGKGSLFSDGTLQQWQLKYPTDSGTLLEISEKYNRGCMAIFNKHYDFKRWGWNCNPLTKEQYPLTHYRLMDKCFVVLGDVKYAFELHKHYGFVQMALAYRMTRNKEYLSSLRGYIVSWQQKYPPNVGIGWVGNIHIAQRMVSWIFTYALLKGRGDETDDVCLRLCKGLKEHSMVLKRRYGSPTNNHKIGSLCSLLIYEIFSGRWNGSECHRYADELTDEVIKQTSGTGAPSEGSISYGRVVLEFLLLVLLFGEQNGYELPDILVERIGKMVIWFNKFMGCEKEYPPIGDESEEKGFPLGNYNDNSFLDIGNFLFGFSRDTLLSSAAWLLLKGMNTKDRFKGTTCNIDESGSLFVDKVSGYGRITKIYGSDRWTIWMRAGKFGLPPDFSHSHSDLLAPVIWFNGKPVITESGTINYNTHTELRLRDVLSEGHSGIRFNMKEHSVWEDIFKWGRSFVSEADMDQDSGLSGFVKMEDETIIERKISVKDVRTVSIEDALEKIDTRSKLLELGFVVDGYLVSDLFEKERVVMFRHNYSGRAIKFSFFSEMDLKHRVSVTEISSGYARNHKVCRLHIGFLAHESCSWETLLIMV